MDDDDYALLFGVSSEPSMESSTGKSMEKATEQSMEKATEQSMEQSMEKTEKKAKKAKTLTAAVGVRRVGDA